LLKVLLSLSLFVNQLSFPLGLGLEKNFETVHKVYSSTRNSETSEEETPKAL